MINISKRKFGEFIRKRRLELIPPVTLRRFAEKVNISPTYLSKIERGDFEPPAEDTIKRIARELQCNEDKLLAMAGKVSSEVTKIITQHPVEAAQFLRTSEGLSKEKWMRLIKEAKNLKEYN